jgi:hypothetical protein
MKPNICKLSLKALRDQINASTHTVFMRDDDDVMHEMVWVPRFRVPANIVSEGVPSRELLLGGFYVDKQHSCVVEYQAGPKALSLSGTRPKTSIEYGDALTAAQARTFYQGHACRVMSLRDWGHLAWLVALLGHPLRGNLDDGIDPRDDQKWENRGEPGYGLTLDGAGPISWRHNGLASGISDLLGNAWHMLACGPQDQNLAAVYAGTLLVRRPATLYQTIDADDVDFQVVDPTARAPYAASPDTFRGWPATDGLVLIGNEWISYGTLTRVPSTNRATLAQCQRGRYGGGGAAEHLEDAEVHREMYHCLIPSGYSGFTGEQLPATPGSITIAWTYGRFWHGTRDTSPAPGDVLCVFDRVHAQEPEDLLVTGVNGDQITVTRGHNGTTVGQHNAGTPFAAYTPDIDNAGSGSQWGYATGALRTHEDLEELYLPAAIADTPSSVEADQRMTMIMYVSASYLLRGAAHNASTRENLLTLKSPENYNDAGADIGFRCVWYPVEEYQFGEE